MSVLRAFLTLLCAVCLAHPAQAEPWLRAQTEHFTFYSDGSEEQLRDLADQAERLDALLRLRFGVPPKTDSRKLDVYMLLSSRHVAQVMKRSSLAGFYSASSEGSFIVTNRGWTMGGLDLSGEITLFHEYAHHFMYRNLARAYPAWYREGFAEYLSTVTFEPDGSWTFGKPATHRMHRILTKEMPLRTILKGDLETMDSGARSTFYAWSWLLTHMLMADPARERQLDAYLACLGEGSDPACAESAFGDLDALEEQLVRYRETDLAFRRSDRPLSVRPQITVSRLDERESALTELTLLRRTQRQGKVARDGLERLAKLYPDDAEIRLQLALAERDVSTSPGDAHHAQAMAQVTRALALNPRLSRAYTLRGELQAATLAGAGDRSNNEAWDAARRNFTVASALAPDDPLPHYLLYRSYLQQKRTPPGTARASMQKAFAMMPESVEVRISWAVALAIVEQLDKAEAIARALVADPHSADVGRKLLAHLQGQRAAAQQRMAAWRAQQKARQDGANQAAN